MLALISFAMLTRLQTTLKWLNSSIRRGLIGQRWPVATWESIIGGHAQCVWRTICISLPLCLWGDGTLAISTVGTPCIYLFLLYVFCVCPPRSLCQPLLCTFFSLSELELIGLLLSFVFPKSSAGGQTELYDSCNVAGLIVCMKLCTLLSTAKKINSKISQQFFVLFWGG